MAVSGQNTDARAAPRGGAGRHRLKAASLALAISFAALVTVASGAGAKTFGLLEQWGTAGTAPGQLNEPAECAVFGVDPVDGSIYMGDKAVGKKDFCRLQKFSAKGVFEGSTEIQIVSNGSVVRRLSGIAVDHTRQHFYLIEEDAGGTATNVLRYSTEPAGEELVSAGTPLSLPAGAEAIRGPEGGTGLAVDPEDGDLVMIGFNAAKTRVILLRVSNQGNVTNRYDVAGSPLASITNGGPARTVTVGKGGIAYVLTGKPGRETRLWRLPRDLSKVEEVPGFAEAAKNEVWTRPLLVDGYSPYAQGTQIAISPDGNTLYFKEDGGKSTVTDYGAVFLRAYSLSEEKTEFVFGGGEYEEGKGVCAIGSSPAPIGAYGNEVVVYDHANDPTESGYFGTPRVLTIGPGGSACVPTTKFSVVNPKDEWEKGEAVVFEAGESDLAGNSLKAYEWDFGDGSEPLVVEGTEAEPTPPPVASHRYLAAGEYTVTLQLKMVNPGTPPEPAEATVRVGKGSPAPYFAGPEGPLGPGQPFLFDGSESLDLLGECTELLGCFASHELESYEWDFGDGTEAGPSPEPTATHAFANPGAAPLEFNVVLTVTNREGVSGSWEEVVSVRGEAEPQGGEVEVGEEAVAPPAQAPALPAGGGKKRGNRLTDAQKQRLARERRRCRKTLKGRARAKCLRNVSSIGKKLRGAN